MSDDAHPKAGKVRELLGWSQADAQKAAARIADLEAALRNLIDRYVEVVTTPDCSCSPDDHDVMIARAALEAGQ